MTGKLDRKKDDQPLSGEQLAELLEDATARLQQEVLQPKLKLPVIGPMLGPEEAPHRCTGHCCKRFFLPLSPAEVREAREQGRYKDIEVIADMLIYLGRSRVSVDGTIRNEASHYYTCRHFDWTTNNCGIYEKRPAMCSEYPYADKCKYHACEMRGNVGVEARGSLLPLPQPSCKVDEDGTCSPAAEEKAS